MDIPKVERSGNGRRRPLNCPSTIYSFLDFEFRGSEILVLFCMVVTSRDSEGTSTTHGVILTVAVRSSSELEESSPRGWPLLLVLCLPESLGESVFFPCKAPGRQVRCPLLAFVSHVAAIITLRYVPPCQI